MTLDFYSACFLFSHFVYFVMHHNTKANSLYSKTYVAMTDSDSEQKPETKTQTEICRNNESHCSLFIPLITADHHPPSDTDHLLQSYS